MASAYHNQKSIDRLKEIMEENLTEKGKPIKPADLSRLTGVSKKHLSNIMTDNKPLTLQTAQKIVKGFPGKNYLAEYLTGDSDYKTEGAAFMARLNELHETLNIIDNTYRVMASIMARTCGIEWDGDRTAYLQNSKTGPIEHDGIRYEHVPGSVKKVKYKDVAFETWELAAIVDETLDYMEFRLDHAANLKKSEKMTPFDRQPVNARYRPKS